MAEIFICYGFNGDSSYPGTLRAMEIPRSERKRVETTNEHIFAARSLSCSFESRFFPRLIIPPLPVLVLSISWLWLFIVISLLIFKLWKVFSFFSSKNFFYFSALQRLWLIVWGGKTRKNDKNFSPLWSFLWTFFKTHEIELLRSFSTEFLFHFICSCMLRASSVFFFVHLLLFHLVVNKI